MRPNQDNGRSPDSVVLLFLLCLFVFFSPFTTWWASIARIWFLPYLMWLGLVVAIAWVVHRRGHDV